MQVSPDILAGQSILHDTFRDRKLLERYLETAALKNDLSLSEAIALLYLSGVRPPRSHAGIWRIFRDFPLQYTCPRAAKSHRSGSASGQRSEGPESGEKQTRFLFTPAAQPVLEDLAQARQEYEAARLDGLMAEEQDAYRVLSQKIHANIQSILQ